MKTEDILKAAHAIRAHLPELLGTRAATVDTELAGLLEKAGAGEDVEIEILDLLSEHNESRMWMQQALSAHENMRGSKGLEPSIDYRLPGDPGTDAP